jgi:hypothetical protein
MKTVLCTLILPCLLHGENIPKLYPLSDNLLLPNRTAEKIYETHRIIKNSIENYAFIKCTFTYYSEDQCLAFAIKTNFDPDIVPAKIVSREVITANYQTKKVNRYILPNSLGEEIEEIWESELSHLSINSYSPIGLDGFRVQFGLNSNNFQPVTGEVWHPEPSSKLGVMAKIGRLICEGQGSKEDLDSIKFISQNLKKSFK